MLQCELIHFLGGVGGGVEFRGFMWKCLVYFPCRCAVCVYVCAFERSASQYLSALPRP